MTKKQTTDAAKAAKIMGNAVIGLPITEACNAASMFVASLVMTLKRDKRPEVSDEEFVASFMKAFTATFAVDVRYLQERDLLRAAAPKTKKKRK